MITFYGDVEKKPAIAVIKNFYTDDELRLIWRELEFLTSFVKMDVPVATGSAHTKDGGLLKANKAIFLDEAYANRLVSDILQVNRKVFDSEVAAELTTYNKLFTRIKDCKADYTLVSYYEDGAYYKPHRDGSCITVLSYFVKDASKVSGGQLYLPEFDTELEVENNMVVFMPSHYLHEVRPVVCSENDYSTYGRYSMAQFIHYK